MKKLIYILICICLLAPMAVGLARAGDAPLASPEPEPDVVSFELPAADPQIAAGSTILRAALMDRCMSRLALQSFYTGEGWNSQSEIPDLWAAVYSYINCYELGAGSEWEHTEQGFVRIDADYVRSLFTTMYGVEFAELPPISRSYSSAIVYDAQSDVYDVIGTDGETVYPALSTVALGPDNSAIMTYSIVCQYVKEGETVDDVLGSVSVHLENCDESVYGLKPVQVELEMESVG